MPSEIAGILIHLPAPVQHHVAGLQIAMQNAFFVRGGEPGDAALLGVVTLEELGLILDPMRRELRPMPMSLMPLRPASR